MKIDKLGKGWAKIGYHIAFVAVLIADWEAVGTSNIISVVVMGMFFLGLCHFTESSE